MFSTIRLLQARWPGVDCFRAEFRRWARTGRVLPVRRQKAGALAGWGLPKVPYRPIGLFVGLSCKIKVFPTHPLSSRTIEHRAVSI